MVETPTTVEFTYTVPTALLDDPAGLAVVERKAILDFRAAYAGHRLRDFEVIRREPARAVYATPDDIVPTRYEPVEDPADADTEVRVLTATVNAVTARANTVDLTEDEETEAMRRLGIAARDRSDFTRDDWISEALDIIEAGHIPALMPEHAVVLADEVKRLRAERLGIQVGPLSRGIPE